jgi:hypothetical protein
MDADAIEGSAAAGERPAVSLLEISRVLEETARLIRQHSPCREPSRPFDSRADLITAPLVRAIIAVRRTRRDHFPCAPGDPAWSILLELYAARLERRKTSQTLLGTAAGVPETTTIRLIKSLVRQGYLVSRHDAEDRRLVLLDLSDDAAERIRAYLTAAIVAGPFPF